MLRHLRLVEATCLLNAGDAVVSHLSAAVVHGLPLASTVSRVQLTRSGAAGGKVRGAVHLYATTLDADDVVEVAGLRVTSLGWRPSSTPVVRARVSR